MTEFNGGLGTFKDQCENYVLDKLNEEGLVWCEMTPDSKLDLGIRSLHSKGIIKSVNELEITFMNEGYCFTYADNRYNLRVVQCSDRRFALVSDLTTMGY